MYLPAIHRVHEYLLTAADASYVSVQTSVLRIQVSL